MYRGALDESFLRGSLVFVHRSTVDFSSGRSALRENNLSPSNLLILWSTTTISCSPACSKDSRGEGFRHPRFREAPRQISSSFVLPFARCQLMNSVCLGRRADKYTLQIHAHVFHGTLFFSASRIFQSGIRSSFFPEGVLRVMLGSRGRDGKMRSTLRGRIIRANVHDVKPPTAPTDEAISTFPANCY